MNMNTKIILILFFISSLTILFIGCLCIPDQNTAPVFDSIPRQAISSAWDFQMCDLTYELTMSKFILEDGGGGLSYSFVGEVPQGMTIDSNSGKIVWNPVCPEIKTRCHQCDDVCITVRAQDDRYCQPSYTDISFCIEVWDGFIDDDPEQILGIGFDDCPIYDGFCL